MNLMQSYLSIYPRMGTLVSPNQVIEEIPMQLVKPTENFYCTRQTTESLPVLVAKLKK